MSLESGSYIKDLVQTNPEGTDPKSQGDDHLRLLKQVLKTQFAGFTQGKPINKTEDQINAMLTAGAGAFGLGGDAITITETDLISQVLPCGFYYCVSQGLGNMPPGVGAIYVVRVDLNAPGYWLNICASADSGQLQGSLWTQANYNGSVGLWRRAWNNIDTPKQTTVLDTNGATMLSPASFGLGVPIAAGASADLNWGPYAKTLYCARWGGNSWVNAPAGEANSIAMVEWKCYNPDWGEQTFISISTKARFVRYWFNAANWTQWFTESTIDSQFKTTPGWQNINGIMHQWGTYAGFGTSGQTANVPFATPFGTCFGVWPNCSAFFAGNYYIVNCTGFTTTQFTLGYMANTPSGSGPVTWHAVGLAP